MYVLQQTTLHTECGYSVHGRKKEGMEDVGMHVMQRQIAMEGSMMRIINEVSVSEHSTR